MKKVTAYKCDYCGKLCARKYNCKKHEECCTKNPKNHRACFECKHLSMRTVDIWKYSNGDYPSSKSDLFFCQKKRIFLYPPKVERNNTNFGVEDIEDSEIHPEDIENKPMPKECEFEDNCM